MLKKSKKFCAILTALVIVASFQITAFAGSSSKSTSGYGKLYGSLNSSGSYVTSVDRNNDRAYLLIGGTIQNKAGTTLITQQNITSSRGATYFSGYWTNIPSSAYALYGAHGVQGGSKYGASVVYTYTRA